MKNNILTIVVPTYNRYYLLCDCIKSIRDIYHDAKIIIGDSSIDLDRNLKDKFDENVEVLDLSEYRGDIYMIFTTWIRTVKTQYVLIVEDDDRLINLSTHKKILSILRKNNEKVVTFANQVTINEKQLTYLTNNFNFNNNTIHDIPTFWNGNFQFGSAYFDTQLLLECFDKWILQDRIRTFDGSIDESITLLAIYKSRQYMHVNEVGLDIGVQDDNISWNNLMMTLYSSSTYIKELRKELNETTHWQYIYENIQLKEIQTMCPTITMDDVYHNNFYTKLRKKLSTQLKSDTSYMRLRQQLVKNLQIYQKVKKYNII